MGDAGPEAATVLAMAAAWGREEGASQGVDKSTQPRPARPRRRRGSWAPEPGSSIQVTSRPGQTLEGTWDRGRGLAPRPWDAGQGRKFCTCPRAVPKPARCQCSSSSATPGPTAPFPAARAFGFPASPHSGFAPALRGQPCAQRDEIRTRRPRRWLDPASPGGPRSAATAGRAGATKQPK